MSVKSDLPPLVLELRAKAGELYSTLGKVKADTKSMADETAASTASMASKTEKATGSMSSKLQTVGAHASKALGIIGLGAIGVGYEALKSATAFQKSTTLLVTAGGEARSNLASVQTGIKNIAMATGENAENLSEGMYIVEKAGMHGASGLKVLKAAAQSAMAEGTDMPTMTNAITSALMSYGKGSNYAATMASQMDRAAGMAKTTMQNFAGSLSTVLPIASASGISFAQVGGAIATLTQHGTTADEATQELSNTIRNLQAPNQVAQKAMQQLGLNVNDLSTHLGQRGLTGTIKLITDTIESKLGPAGTVVVNAFQQQASASQDLQVMLSKMPPTLAKQARAFANGAESYKTFYGQAKNLGGTSFEMAKQFISLTSKAEGFNNILKSGQPAQQTAAKMLKDVMGGATGLNTALMLSGHNATYFNKAVGEIQGQSAKANGDISNWAETQTTLSVQLAKAKQHIEVLGLNIGAKLIPIVEKALEVTTKVFTWLGSHKDVLIGIAVLFGTVLVGALMAAVAAWVTASVAFMTSPLGLIVMGVMALIAGIVLLLTHWTQAWNAMKEALVEAWNFIKGIFTNTIGWIKTHWKLLAEILVAIFVPGGIVLVAVAKFWPQILKFFTAGWNDVKAITSKVIGWMKSFLSGTWRDIQQVARDAWNLIKTVIVNPVMDTVHGVESVFGAVEGFFIGLWNRVTGAAQGAWNLFRDYIVNPVKTMWTDLQTIGNKIAGFFQGIWDTITGAAESAWNGITSGIQSALSVAGQIMADVINGLVDAVNFVINGINTGTHALSDVWSWTGLPPIPAIPDIPQVSLANGGIAKATPGGIIARIAEAGTDEAVIPLDGRHGIMGAPQTYNVQVTVQGSVIAEQDLAQVVRTQLLRLGARHGETYQPYRR